jgi:two-component system nitrate/nitrite response regulator NarL
MEDPMKAQSVLLVEASPLFRSALTSILSRIRVSVSLAGKSGNRRRARRDYDAVLVDIATFPGDAGQLADLIQDHVKIAPVLLLAREDRLDQIIICLRAGATGLVRQTASERNLRDAISAVAAGFAWCDGQLFRTLARYLLPVGQGREPDLTKREADVLRCLAQGQANKEIASTLALSEQSAKVYVSRLLRKLGVPNRGWLALHGIVRSTEAA